MNEVLKPLYDKVEKILKGESIGIINIGASDAFNQVSKEFIGYNCFGRVIWEALHHRLESSIGNMRQAGYLMEEEVFVSQGSALSDWDVAFELSELLFPPVLSLVHDKDEYVSKVIDSMYAFVRCDEYTINSLFEILGDTFKKAYTERYGDNVPKTTEKLYDTIVYMMPF